MLYTIARIVFFIISVVCAVKAIFEFKKEKGNFKKFIIYILILIISTLCNLFPPENALFTFSSPDYVQSYMSTSKEYIVVQGAESALIADEYQSIFAKRAKNGWKMVDSSEITLIEGFPAGNFYINIYRFGETNDYYIEIKLPENKNYNITHNRNSEFSVIGNKDGDYFAFSYIHDFSYDNYSLNLDGKTWFTIYS